MTNGHTAIAARCVARNSTPFFTPYYLRCSALHLGAILRKRGYCLAWSEDGLSWWETLFEPLELRVPVVGFGSRVFKSNPVTNITNNPQLTPKTHIHRTHPSNRVNKEIFLLLIIHKSYHWHRTRPSKQFIYLRNLFLAPLDFVDLGAGLGGGMGGWGVPVSGTPTRSKEEAVKAPTSWTVEPVATRV